MGARRRGVATDRRHRRLLCPLPTAWGASWWCFAAGLAVSMTGAVGTATRIVLVVAGPALWWETDVHLNERFGRR